MNYEQDYIARYLACRVLNYEKDNTKGMSYELAVTSAKTTQENIDRWLRVYRDEQNVSGGLTNEQ